MDRLTFDENEVAGWVSSIEDLEEGLANLECAEMQHILDYITDLQNTVNNLREEVDIAIQNAVEERELEEEVKCNKIPKKDYVKISKIKGKIFDLIEELESL